MFFLRENNLPSESIHCLFPILQVLCLLLYFSTFQLHTHTHVELLNLMLLNELLVLILSGAVVESKK